MVSHSEVCLLCICYKRSRSASEGVVGTSCRSERKKYFYAFIAWFSIWLDHRDWSSWNKWRGTGGPVFLAMLLCKILLEKREDSAVLCSHTQRAIIWPLAVFCVAFNSCAEVWWYKERQAVLCVCTYPSLCMCWSDRRDTERSWQEHQEMTGSSCFQAFCSYTPIIAQNELTKEEVCRINVVFV